MDGQITDEFLAGGWLVRWYDVLSSTNDAARWPSADASNMVIAADFQISGRGQRGNTWSSLPAENLLFTIVQQVDMPVQALPVHNQKAALAVALAVKDLLPEAEVLIKWPNDILVEKRKVAGMLIETVIEGNRVKKLITGIGLNVNQTNFQLQPKATSLKTAGGSAFDRKAVLKAIMSKTDEVWATLHRDGDVARYYHANLFGYGKTNEYRLPGSDAVFTALSKGIDELGRLCLLHEDGRTQVYDIKEIEQIY